MTRAAVFAVLAWTCISTALVVGFLFGCPSLSMFCGLDPGVLGSVFPVPLALVIALVFDAFQIDSNAATLATFVIIAIPSNIALYRLWRWLGSWWKFLLAYIAISLACTYACYGLILYRFSSMPEEVVQPS